MEDSARPRRSRSTGQHDDVEAPARRRTSRAVKQIRRRSRATSDYDREASGAAREARRGNRRHQGRRATETEMKEKKARVEDACHQGGSRRGHRSWRRRCADPRGQGSRRPEARRRPATRRQHRKRARSKSRSAGLRRTPAGRVDRGVGSQGKTDDRLQRAGRQDRGPRRRRVIDPAKVIAIRAQNTASPVALPKLVSEIPEEKPRCPQGRRHGRILTTPVATTRYRNEPGGRSQDRFCLRTARDPALSPSKRRLHRHSTATG